MSSSDEREPEIAATGGKMFAGKQSDARPANAKPADAKPAKTKPADPRTGRLAAALRQNLQRRKAQARGRKPAGKSAQSGEE
jgi:hypothetical protein